MFTFSAFTFYTLYMSTLKMLASIQEPKVKSYAPCRQPISERMQTLAICWWTASILWAKKASLAQSNEWSWLWDCPRASKIFTLLPDMEALLFSTPVWTLGTPESPCTLGGQETLRDSGTQDNFEVTELFYTTHPVDLLLKSTDGGSVDTVICPGPH